MLGFPGSDRSPLRCQVTSDPVAEGSIFEEVGEEQRRVEEELMEEGGRNRRVGEVKEVERLEERERRGGVVSSTFNKLYSWCSLVPSPSHPSFYLAAPWLHGCETKTGVHEKDWERGYSWCSQDLTVRSPRKAYRFGSVCPEAAGRLTGGRPSSRSARSHEGGGGGSLGVGALQGMQGGAECSLLLFLIVVNLHRSQTAD